MERVPRALIARMMGAMSIFTPRPGLRWAVPAGIGAVVIGGALLGPVVASADAGLPPRTAEELLVAVQGAEPVPVSGTLAVDANLGLPDLPMGTGSSGPMSLASGASTLRVWSDGADRQRVALLDTRAETTIVRNGDVAWVWSSQDATADRYQLPKHTSGSTPDTGDLPPGVTLPKTPQEAAELALSALDKTTEVTTSGAATVAGRDAYQLVLTPRDDKTLVKRVTLSLDAETMVPLRVQIDSTRSTDPALRIGFTSVDFAAPDANVFDFTPPAGATVTEHAAPSDGAAADAGQTGAAPVGTAEPTVLGNGWSTIVVGELPKDALANLAEAGSTGTHRQGPHASGNSAATALALLEALPHTTGSWGSGRVLSGTVFSAILTDDGRYAIGAVPPEALGEALGAALSTAPGTTPSSTPSPAATTQ